MATPSRPKTGKAKTGKAGARVAETDGVNTAEHETAKAAAAAAKTVKPKSAKSKAAAANTATEATVVSLKVTLDRIDPPIWRRLLLPTTMTLGHLHLALQAAMGWDDYHMHAFEIAGRQYHGREDENEFVDEEEEDDDEHGVTLGALVSSRVRRIKYTYDYGDNWNHIIAIEKTRPAVAGETYPRCIAGERACPPEDSGGPWGYQDLLDILADPKHPRHAERREWVGDNFDPEAFDLAATDAELAVRFGQR